MAFSESGDLALWLFRLLTKEEDQMQDGVVPFLSQALQAKHGVLIAGAVDRMGAVGEEIDKMTCGIWRRFCMRLSTANKAKAPAWKTCPSLLLVFLDCIKSSNVFSCPIWASYNFHLTSLSQDVIARAACSVALSFVPQGEVGIGHHHTW